MPRDKRPPEEGDIILVRWHDTTGRGRWVDRPEAKKDKALSINTVGYYLNEDKQVVRLHSQSCDEDKQVSDTHVLPKGMIKSISVIKRGKRRK